MKKQYALLVVASALVFSGCGQADNILSNILQDQVMKLAGISEDEDYQTYQDLQDSELLNQDGEYNELDKDEYQIVDEELNKQVRVTIADNGFLKIQYYYDASLTEKVEGTTIYLDPGEKLYCSQPESDNDYSNTYVFSEFQIYEFNSDGTRGDLYATSGEDSVVLEIPDDYSGTELAIMPVGVYEKRGLTFNAFYYDENGQSKSVQGVWSVNDEPCINDVANVNASESYTVKFEYDEDVYYYVSSDPAAYNSNIPGLVEFTKATSLNGTDTYSVQLHQFITANFSFDNVKRMGIDKVELNGEKIEDFDNKAISKLKTGDKLTITTSDNYRVFCNGLPNKDPEHVKGGYKYTYKIADTNESKLDFKVSKSELKVSLDSSVGYDMAFDIVASGVSEKELYYSKQTLNSDMIVFDGTIGAEERISISARNASIEKGHAIKVEVEKTDGNSNKTKEIKYITSIPGTADIDIYNGTGEIKNLNKIFKKVIVNISDVEVTDFVEKTVENGTITAKLVDCTSPEILKNGVSAEGSRKVEVTIVPNEGYYVSGKNVTNYAYKSEMKLSKYVSGIDSIIAGHPIKKLYSVSLDSTDSIGTVTYKLNGDEVSGNIKIREEDKLMLEYELTDENYRIIREGEGVFDKVNNVRKNTFSKNKETVEIKLSDSIDGKSIKRADYITVSKKGAE